MGEREVIGKIRGEKHVSNEEKYFLGRKKFNPNFTERGQVHCDILKKCRDLRKEARYLKKKKIIYLL